MSRLRKKNYRDAMKSIISFFVLSMCSIAQAATPIEGLYYTIFGGYAYVPGNINHDYNGATLNNSSYRDGFEAGGSLGFKSNPMRYELEIKYLQANVKGFSVNGTPQTNTSGNNQDVLGMANILVDIPNFANALLLPYIGGGIGYGWFHSSLGSSAPNSVAFSATNWPFAYQGIAGITFNFAENYALNANYCYIGTTNLGAFGEVFQAHIANIGVTYRFDGKKYK